MVKIILTTRKMLSGLALLLIGMSLLPAQTETPKQLRFNGLGRAIIDNTQLNGTISEGDTTTAQNTLDGEFLLDLKINAAPNEKTEVQTILRLRNEFGGFFGAGMSIEVRELFARGVVANVLRYHVGDMDLKMTPFTFYQVEEEGIVKEAEIFKARREVVNYEQFYNGDGTRRMQGGKFDFGLSAGPFFSEINVSGFFTRVRGTDFFTLPTRSVAGGTIELINPRWGTLTGNYVNTYDILSVGNFGTGIRNPVQTLSADIKILDEEKYALNLVGEIGQSSIREVTDSVVVFEKDDTFGEGMLSLDLKPQNVKVSLGFRNVGPDFFSIGAQSKRVDFERSKTDFNRIGNERLVRNPTIYDLNRDRNIYTFALSDVLMPYDMRLSNTMPYGKATPNRRGFIGEVNYGKEDGFLNAGFEFAQMSEIRGQGTFELKSFTLLRLKGEAHFEQLLESEKALVLTLGAQVEQTRRGGQPIEQVDLNSNLIETGLQVELFENFDLLLGAKLLTSSGSDYNPDIVRFNVVRDFPGRVEVDDNETLLGAGIRYRFSDGIYLSIQWNQFSFARATNPNNDYRIDQAFVLYNMNF